MREITRSVKGALNVILQSFLPTSIYRIGLQKLSIQSHLRPFSATVVLRMRRNGNLWTSGVNLDTTVRFADPDFLLECQISTFSVDYCILYSECPPYFYFRFVWPTDLESIPHSATPTSIIPSKFEVDMTIHCRVIAFLSADTSRGHVTLTLGLLTLISCSSWRVTWPTLLPSLRTPCLSVLD